MEEGGTTQERLASILKVSRLTVNQLVNGRRAVTAEMALRLARAFSTSVEFWLNLQRAVDIHQARIRVGPELSRVKILRVPTPERELFIDVPADT